MRTTGFGSPRLRALTGVIALLAAVGLCVSGISAAAWISHGAGTTQTQPTTDSSRARPAGPAGRTHSTALETAVAPRRARDVYQPPVVPHALGLRLVTVDDFSMTSAPTYSLSGTVYLYNDGTAPAGSVTVYAGTNPESTIGSAGSAVIDANGNYTIHGLVSGDYFVYFKYSGNAGYFSNWFDQYPTVTDTNFAQEIDSANVTDIDDTLRPGGTLEGHLTLGAADSPVAGGDISVTYEPADGSQDVFGPSSQPVLVDSNGNYSFSDLPYGFYGLHFSYSGGGPYGSMYFGGSDFEAEGQSVLVQPDAPAWASGSLPDLENLSGHIYLGTTSTSAGTGDATVTLSYTVLPTLQVVSLPNVSATTDSSGQYEFTGLYPFDYTLTVTYTGEGAYARSTTYYNPYEFSNPRVEDVTLAPTYSISGRVFLGTTTMTPADGNVHVTATSVYADTTAPTTVVTDSDGDYTISGLTADYYHLAFHYSGPSTFVDQSPNVDACGFVAGCSISLRADRSDVNVTLPSGNKISGNVTTDGGAALAGVSVSALDIDPNTGDTLSDTNTTTAADGTYSLDLPDGNYEIDFSDAGYADESFDNEDEFYEPDDLDVTGNDIVTDVDATMHLIASISGSVKLSSSASVEGDVDDGDVFVDLELYDLGSKQWVDVTPAGDDAQVTGTSGDYSYSITGLAPDNYRALLIYDSGSLYGQDESGTVDLRAGENATVNLGVTPVEALVSDTLVRTPSSSKIYFVDAGDNLIPVRSPDVMTAMGLPTHVSVVPSDAVIPNSTNGNTLSSEPLSGIVRCYGSDYVAGSGGIRPIDTDFIGSVHVTTLQDFTCDQIVQYDDPVMTIPVLIDSSTGTGWELNSGEKMGDPANFGATLRLFAGDLQSGVIRVAHSFLNSLPTGPDALLPGDLVRIGSGSTTYMIDGTTGLVPVPNLDVVKAMGLSTSYARVAASRVNGMTVEAEPLVSVVECDGPSYYIAGGGGGASGGLAGIANNLASALPSIALTRFSCDALPGAPLQFNYALFVRSTSSSTVWYVDPSGVRHQIESAAAMARLSAPDAAHVLIAADSFVDSLTVGDPILSPGELVTSSSGSTVYLVDGFSGLVPVTDPAVATDMGSPAGIVTVPDALITARTIAAAPLDSVVSCSGNDYVGGSGKLWPISASLVPGLTITPLDPLTCSSFPRSTTHIIGLLVRSSSSASSPIWWIDKAGRRDLITSSADAATVSAPGPVIYLTVPQSFIDSIPVGRQLVPAS